MNQFDDIIYNIINSVEKTGDAANSTLRSEALISAQTAIMQLEVIKSAIAKKGLPDEAGKLLLYLPLSILYPTLPSTAHPELANYLTLLSYSFE